MPFPGVVDALFVASSQQRTAASQPGTCESSIGRASAEIGFSLSSGGRNSAAEEWPIKTNDCGKHSHADSRGLFTEAGRSDCLRPRKEKPIGACLLFE